jgi:hypothetical protein
VWRIEPARAARPRRASAAPDEIEMPRSDEPRPSDVEDLPF